ncbi:MAG: ATP synthase F1 subunit delta [Halarsenatibacteraceae bacterium]
MIENEIAKKYGKAIFELASEQDQLEEVNNDLQLLRSTIKESADFKNLLYHPRIAVDKKKEVFLKIIEDEISELTAKFCQLLIDKRRITFINAIARDFELRLKEFSKILEVELQAAIELPDDLIDQIRRKLADILDYEIELNSEVNKDLIGGIRIKIGDKVIDGSIKSELEELQKRLEQIPVSKLGVE